MSTLNVAFIEKDGKRLVVLGNGPNEEGEELRQRVGGRLTGELHITPDDFNSTGERLLFVMLMAVDQVPAPNGYSCRVVSVLQTILDRIAQSERIATEVLPSD